MLTTTRVTEIDMQIGAQPEPPLNTRGKRDWLFALLPAHLQKYNRPGITFSHLATLYDLRVHDEGVRTALLSLGSYTTAGNLMNTIALFGFVGKAGFRQVAYESAHSLTYRAGIIAVADPNMDVADITARVADLLNTISPNILDER